MKHEHKDIQTWIKKKYGRKYNIEVEIVKQNKLPDAKRHWYQPDVIIKNKNGKIKYIIEVENDPVRKVIVGASILADASLKELKEKGDLYFVIYDPKGIRQIHNFQLKAKIAKEYCHNLNKINVFSFEEFKKINL